MPLPLLYDPRSAHDAFLAQFVIAIAAYLVLGGAIIAGKRLMWRLQVRAEQLAAEQVSLRRSPPRSSAESRPSASTSSSPVRRPPCSAAARRDPASRARSRGGRDGLVGRPRGRPLRARQGDRGSPPAATSIRRCARTRCGSNPIPPTPGRSASATARASSPRSTSRAGTWGVIVVAAADRAAHARRRGRGWSSSAICLRPRSSASRIARSSPHRRPAIRSPASANHRTLQQRLTVEVARCTASRHAAVGGGARHRSFQADQRQRRARRRR